MRKANQHTRSTAAKGHELRATTTAGAVQAHAESRLRQSTYPELHLLSCDFHEGVLTLRGRVPSYYLKQVAQTLILQVNGVDEINNRLEVADHQG
jgi:osmotically-inducible protein OsmY